MKFKLIFLLFLLCFPLVLSAPPVTTVQQFTEGYLVGEISHQYLRLGESYQYNFYVFNQSNGVLMNDTFITCNFHLFNSSGTELFSGDTAYDPDGHWGIFILGGNFSSIGSYPYSLNCQDDLGGALAGIFEVNPTGYETDNMSVVYLILTILVLLGIFLYLASQYMDNEKTFGVGLYFYLISFILLVYVLFLQFNIMEKGLYWLGLTNIQLVLFYGITYSLVGITFIGFTYLLVKYLDNIRASNDSKSYGNDYDNSTKSYKY